MQHGEIMVNNNKLRPVVIPPSNSDILLLKDQELEKIRAIKLVYGPEHTEKNSSYFCAIFKAKSKEDVDLAYKKAKIKFPDATHISCAYRLGNPFGPYCQQAIDDGDIGIGRSILSALKAKEITEMGVFIIRFYGGTHLAKRRFEIAEFLTEKVVAR